MTQAWNGRVRVVVNRLKAMLDEPAKSKFNVTQSCPIQHRDLSGRLHSIVRILEIARISCKCQFARLQ